VVTRFELKQVEAFTLENGECRFTVSLACNGDEYIGEAISPDTEDRRLEAVAQATLQSISKFLPQSVRLRLDQAGKLTFSSQAMVFVVVEIVEGLSLQFLSGTCLSNTASLDTAAKAILDALNRKMEAYLPREE
jgi:hypothetical protein